MPNVRFVSVFTPDRGYVGDMLVTDEFIARWDFYFSFVEE